MIFKIFQVVLILGLIYLWNRFIIKFMIKHLIGFHKKYNKKNLNSQPIKFVIDNEGRIYSTFCAFYWIGGLVISYVILFTA